MRLIVEDNKKNLYVCMQTTETKWKCGKCLHGNVDPRIRTQCRVCGSSVENTPKGTDAKGEK